MLGYNRVTEAIAKAKCCLPVLGAKKFNALSRSECTDDSFLKVSLALDILNGYIPDGTSLFTIPVYTEAIDNNPDYTQNDPAFNNINMNLVSFNGRWNINNDITRFFSTVDITVIINGVIIGIENGVIVNSVDDYVVAATDIINNSGHDYTAFGEGDKISISQPIKNNVLRSGQNNSGAYKNSYEVEIRADGVYPDGMCDYTISIPIGDYVANINFINFIGMSVDGVYSDFQSPVSWIANYPYGNPLYDFGLQKQIDLMLNPGNVIYHPVIILIPDISGQILSQLDIVIQATYNTVDFIRLEIDSPNYGGVPVIIDYSFSPENCGTGFFTIYFQNGSNTNPVFENGTYLLGSPVRRCTYGLQISSDNTADSISAVDINGVRYNFSSELPLNNPSTIQSELESLTSLLGITWDITYNDSDDPSLFTIRQTNYSFNVPDAASFIINGIEDVRPFEKLSCIVFNETNYSVVQSEDTQCMQESSIEKAIAVIEQYCCGCSGEQTTPMYPNLINVIEGDNDNSMITDENNNPIET